MHNIVQTCATFLKACGNLFVDEDKDLKKFIVEPVSIQAWKDTFTN